MARARAKPIKRVKPKLVSRHCDACPDGLVVCKTKGGGYYLCPDCASEYQAQLDKLGLPNKEVKLLDLTENEWLDLYWDHLPEQPEVEEPARISKQEVESRIRRTGKALQLVFERYELGAISEREMKGQSRRLRLRLDKLYKEI